MEGEWKDREEERKGNEGRKEGRGEESKDTHVNISSQLASV